MGITTPARWKYTNITGHRQYRRIRRLPKAVDPDIIAIFRVAIIGHAAPLISRRKPRAKTGACPRVPVGLVSQGEA